MSYIYDFSVASALYLAIVFFFYQNQRKVPGKRESLYRWLLVCCWLALIFDVACAVIDPVAMAWPRWLSLALNFGLLIFTQISGPLLSCYCLVLTGSYPRWRSWQWTLLWLPWTIAAVLLLLALGGLSGQWGVYYLDANNSYCHGSLHLLLYGTMAFYLLISLFIVWRSRRLIQRRKLRTIYSFLVIVLISMLVQLSLPRVLLNSTAYALAMVMMFYALQPPNEHIDRLTGAFNRNALPLLLSELKEQNQGYTLLLVPLLSLKYVNRTLGLKAGDRLLRDCARCLQRAFPHLAVVRADGNVFALLDADSQRPYDSQTLSQAGQLLRTVLRQEMDMPPSVCLIAVNSREDESAEAALQVINYIIQEQPYRGAGPELLADEALLARCAYLNQVEAAVESALREGRVEVYYQPLHRGDGALAALEALCRINDPELGFISPELFIRLAERNGSIHRLGEAVLRQTCAFIRDQHLAQWALDHVGVNLSVAQCMREGAGAAIGSIVAEYGVSSSLLSFEITETEAVAAISLVRQNMLDLTEQGFSFLLDDFGSGFANFDYISKFPFSCVKLDKELLWAAEDNPEALALLSGVCHMLPQLGLTSVCEGVETAAQAERVRQLGVTLQQGYYYARPLPPAELLAYAARCGVVGEVRA